MMDCLLACFNCCFPAAHFISSIFLMGFETFFPNILVVLSLSQKTLVGSESFPNALVGSELGSTTAEAQCGMDVSMYIS